jgi:hypothetical protein
LDDRETPAKLVFELKQANRKAYLEVEDDDEFENN